jgi:hypothetical protein
MYWRSCTVGMLPEDGLLLLLLHGPLLQGLLLQSL